MNFPTPTPGTRPDAPYPPPHEARPTDVEPGTSPTAPDDAEAWPASVPDDEPRTEPDDRMGASIVAHSEEHPAARLAVQALGATVGAVGGAVAGSVLGIAAGPLGSLAGAVAGAAMGGMAGAGAGVDTAGSGPVDEEQRERDDDAHWLEAFTGREYVREGTRFEDWAPAYRYGAKAYGRHAPMGTWSEAESRLGLGWHAARGDSTLDWDEARHAAREGWERRKQQGR